MPYIENFFKKQSIYWDWHVIYRLVQSNAKLLWFVYLWILIRNNCIFVKDFSKKINFLRISLSMNRRPEIKVLLLSELKKVHKWQMLNLKKKKIKQKLNDLPVILIFFEQINYCQIVGMVIIVKVLKLITCICIILFNSFLIFIHHL